MVWPLRVKKKKRNEECEQKHFQATHHPHDIMHGRQTATAAVAVTGIVEKKKRSKLELNLRKICGSSWTQTPFEMKCVSHSTQVTHMLNLIFHLQVLLKNHDGKKQASIVKKRSKSKRMNERRNEWMSERANERSSKQASVFDNRKTSSSF